MVGEALATVRLTLELVKAFFVKSPAEKERDRLSKKMRERAKHALERHKAAQAFRGGKTSRLERYLDDVLRR